MTKIARNPLVVQKEKQLQDLQKQKNKLTTRLQQHKNRLQQLQTDIVQLQQQVGVVMIDRLEQLASIKNQMVATLQEISRSKKIPKADRRAARQFADELKDTFEIDETLSEIKEQRERLFQEYKEQRENDHSSENSGRQQSLSSLFAVAVPEEEQRRIRKLFLQLASRFHPDKASNPREVEHFTVIMRQLNEAYEQGDYQTLLDLEQEYVHYNSEIYRDTEHVEGLLQWIETAIERATADVSLLNSQLQRVQTELKNLQKSDVGKMCIRDQKLAGTDGSVAETIVQIEQETTQLNVLLNLLKEFLAEGIWDEHRLDSALRKFSQAPPQQMQSINYADLDESELADFLDMLAHLEKSSRPKKRRR